MPDEEQNSQEPEPKVIEASHENHHEPEARKTDSFHDDHDDEGRHKHGHKSAASQSGLGRFKTWYSEHKKLSIPVTVLILLIIILGIPAVRYKTFGLVVKKDVYLQIQDSKLHTPVSNAYIYVDQGTNLDKIYSKPGPIKEYHSDAQGMVKLPRLALGVHPVIIHDKYYVDSTQFVKLDLWGSGPTSTTKALKISFTSTVEPTVLSITDKITGEPLAGVKIAIKRDDNSITATTDKSGSVTLAIPDVNGPPDNAVAFVDASLSATGYNNLTVKVQVSQDKVEKNTAALTPVGKIYFLSKLSGKIDVVKTDLDGSNRETVLAGTGREDDRNTVLLASRDWKYLALLARRDTVAKLYLMDTSNDKLTTMDESNTATFNPVGWSDDNFIYTVYRNNLASWQPNAQAIKSYNASARQNQTLDQTGAVGTNNFDYAQESYGTVYQVGKNVIYSKAWASNYYNDSVLADKQAGIYSISASGGKPQTLKTLGYESGKSTYINSVPYEADKIYYQVTEKEIAAYYAYDNGKVVVKSDIADEFNEYYHDPLTYLQSPSGNETFWAEQRDGKNTLFLGNDSGENGKQIASLSDYFTYGWFTDNYLLVSKNSSELYIMTKKGPTDAQKPLKISDYHKPSTTFRGYGGGYGGL
jgi:hypothetical protein